MSGIDIAIEVEASGWPDGARFVAHCENTLRAAAGFLESEYAQSFADPEPGVSVLLSDDATVRDLNRAWRGIDRPTNVLSFPALSIRAGALPEASSPGLPPAVLGDIVLAFETTAAEARDAGLSLDAHAAHLLVHGFLHLLGHDHADAEEAERMETLEIRILATLGLSDPYRDSDPV